MKRRNVIVLGHSGFIGSRLETLLSGAGFEVTGRSLPDVDLTDPESAAQLRPFLTVDTSIILAAAIKRQFGDTIEALQKNLAMVMNVAALLQKNPVNTVIFMSSAAVYGEETHNVNIHEQTQVNPTSFYGISKYAAERVLKKVCRENGGIRCVMVRPPLIYGPGDPGRTYGPSGFLAAAAEGKTITLWGDGTELREFIYIDDLCAALSALLESEFAGEINMVSGQRYCFADVIEELKMIFPGLTVDMRPRTKDKADNAFNASLISSVLPNDFRFTTLRDGLARMAAGRTR